MTHLTSFERSKRLQNSSNLSNCRLPCTSPLYADPPVATLSTPSHDNFADDLAMLAQRALLHSSTCFQSFDKYSITCCTSYCHHQDQPTESIAAYFRLAAARIYRTAETALSTSPETLLVFVHRPNVHAGIFDHILLIWIAARPRRARGDGVHHTGPGGELRSTVESKGEPQESKVPPTKLDGLLLARCARRASVTTRASRVVIAPRRVAARAPRLSGASTVDLPGRAVSPAARRRLREP